MTFARKVTFRSDNHERLYFEMCIEAIKRWRSLGPQVLKPEIISSESPGFNQNLFPEEITSPGGVYLFQHRNKIVRYFAPNFLPPYDSPEKVNIIQRVLEKKWDSSHLSFIESEIFKPISSNL